jgi:hypothetical protein
MARNGAAGLPGWVRRTRMLPLIDTIDAAPCDARKATARYLLT